MNERLGPTRLFIKYILNNKLHCTEAFLPHELAAQVKHLKSLNVEELTIHYTNKLPDDHIS